MEPKYREIFEMLILDLNDQKENEQVFESLKRNFEVFLEMLSEEEYRRGYSHGYETGIITKPETKLELRKKISYWRHNLDNKLGSPGSLYEDVVMDYKSQS